MLLQNDEDLLERLRAYGVEFVIIGGLCAVIHGASLVTKDVDICCRFDTENLKRLEAAVKNLHPVHRMTPQKIPFVLDEQLCRDLRNVYLRTDLGMLDCLSDVAGIGSYEDALRLSVPCLSGRFRMLNLDAMIMAKQATGRDKDREAIVLLTAIKEKKSKN
ncbi:MAG: nucleotidyltransferase [Verrucomicrobiales bacterium]|nr:nucleotidyltransferase [Verrucomicrobiales bacterium]